MEEGVLELVSDELVNRTVGPLLRRFGALGTGAVLSGVLVVSAATILRRVPQARDSRIFRWTGAAAALPIAAWLVSEFLDTLDEEEETRARDESEEDVA